MGEGMERGEDRQSPASDRQHITSQTGDGSMDPLPRIQLAYQHTVETVARSKGTEDRARGGFEENLNSSFGQTLQSNLLTSLTTRR